MTYLLDTSKLIIGQPGSGKTVTAKAEVQQLLEQRRHVAVIDPTGVWWGMRSNAEGTSPGFDIPIFGGEHGDVPIRAADGAAIARIIVQQRVSAIVDLSSIDNSRDWRRFMADFVAELRKKPRGNFHLVVDEADEFAAERPVDDIGFALRENMIWIAKRGRVHGFVPTYITQRTAEIAKAVISPAQTIIAHQLTAPSDKKPVDDYLKDHGEPTIRREVIGSLASLAIGERWIYSPRLNILERGFTPALTTFDSSRTPAPGELLVEPRTLAQLDVTAIRAALAPALPGDAIPASPIEAFKTGGSVATMIVEFDRRIAQLEDENADLLSELSLLRGVDAECERYSHGLAEIGRLVDALLNGRPIADLQRTDAYLHRENASSGTVPDLHPPVSAQAAPVAEGAPPGEAGNNAPSYGGAPDREQRALAGLAAIYPIGLTDAAWAQRTGYSRKGGAWIRRRKRYVDQGLIELREGRWFATAAGVAAAGDEIPTMPPPGLGLVKFWSTRLGPSGRILELLAAIAPKALTRDAIAAEVRMAPKGGAFIRHLAELKRAELIAENRKRLAIAPGLMGDD